MSGAPKALASELIARCRALGFAAAGVCGVEPSAWGSEFEAWLAQGKHGSMGYLERNLAIRLDPGRLLPGARSAIMVADLYESRGAASDSKVAPGRGRIARYARGLDYHQVIKKRLHELCDALRERYPDEEFRAFVDTAPVLERELAARAGLGWTAKHTLVIHPRLGSYALLGGALTTLELEAPEEQRRVEDHCGTCTRCIEACPTDAIAPYSVDASRCISYLTIERREAIAEEFYEEIGDWLFGCDICQEVCPHNSPRPEGADVGEPHEAYAARRDSFDLLEVLGWSEEDRRAAFTTSALKRATLAMFKRNALIVAGNQLREREAPELRARIESVAVDDAEDEMVRATARAVLDRLGEWAEGFAGSD